MVDSGFLCSEKTNVRMRAWLGNVKEMIWYLQMVTVISLSKLHIGYEFST